MATPRPPFFGAWGRETKPAGSIGRHSPAPIGMSDRALAYMADIRFAAAKAGAGAVRELHADTFVTAFGRHSVLGLSFPAAAAIC